MKTTDLNRGFGTIGPGSGNMDGGGGKRDSTSRQHSRSLSQKKFNAANMMTTL